MNTPASTEESPLSTLEQRVAELESLQLFQERLLDELNAGLLAANKELLETRRDFDRLRAQVSMLQAGDSAPATHQQEPPPPHY